MVRRLSSWRADPTERSGRSKRPDACRRAGWLTLAICWCSTLIAAVDAPPGTLLEAEATRPGGAWRTINDADASGGLAATSDLAWGTIFRSDLPPDAPAFTIHVRHKHGPFLLKRVGEDGQQSDLRWCWAKPDDWTWTAMGTYSREQLGRGVVIIRERVNDGVPGPLLDCVVFAPADPPPPVPTNVPATAPVQDVALSIDWSRTAGRITPWHWAFNDIEVLKAEADPAYQTWLASLRPAFVRIHSAGLANTWTDPATRTWRADRIRAGFAGMTGWGDALVMLNLPRCPAWLCEGLPDSAAMDEMVRLARELATLLKSIGHPPAYWELLNEGEEAWEKAGRVDDYWQLILRMARAIKAVDPAAKVGGPALSWPKESLLEGYLRACGGELDFVSWHQYGGGSHTKPNAAAFESALSLGRYPAPFRELQEKLHPGHPLEMFITEANLSYSWDPFERRHANQLGAIWLAIGVHRAALAGADGVMMWHSKGTAFGLLDNDNRPRPAAALYRLGRDHLCGEMAVVESGDEAAVEAIAVTGDDGGRALLLIVKADHPVRLTALGTSVWHGTRLDADGQRDVAADLAQPLELPGYSLTLLRP